MVYLTTYEHGQDRNDNRRQREHMLGRRLLDYGLRQEYALFLSDASIKTGEYGKPYLEGRPEIQFSISHCDGMAVCGIHHDGIGVDVERIRPFSVKAAKRMMSEEEAQAEPELSPKAFFRYWTLKESYLKAIGTGLAYPMKNITFWWDEEGTIHSSQPDYEFYQSFLYGRFWLAVCIKKA